MRRARLTESSKTDAAKSENGLENAATRQRKNAAQPAHHVPPLHQSTNLSDGPTPPAEPTRLAWGETLSQLRDLSAILTIYIFFAGWSHQYFYLRALGVPPNAVDIPFHATLASAANVFVQASALLEKLLALVGLSIIGLLAYKRQRWRFYLLLATLVALLPAISWLAYCTASDLAEKRLASGDFRGIRFAFRPNSGAQAGDVERALAAYNSADRGLCLLVAVKDRFWVMPCAPAGTGRRVYEIKGSDVFAAQVDVSSKSGGH